MAEFDLTDGINSRIESSLTGAEGKFSAPVSRLERIINGEDIKPLSRIEEVMKNYGGGGGVIPIGYDEYQALSPEEKADEKKVYMINEDSLIPYNVNLSFGLFNHFKEGSMDIDSNAFGGINYHWLKPGAYIGASSRYTLPSEATEIYYKVVTGEHSYSNDVAYADRFRAAVGISNTLYSYVYPDPSYSPYFFCENSMFNDLNTTYEGHIVLSEVSGLDLSQPVYLYLTGHGWDLDGYLGYTSNKNVPANTLIYYQNGRFIKN